MSDGGDGRGKYLVIFPANDLRFRGSVRWTVPLVGGT